MANILTIVKHPDPRLKQRSSELSKEELTKPETQQLIDDMIATMWQADGIGIAAVQIGRNIQICVITKEREVIVLINPKITRHSFRKDVMEEGCLSVPGFYGPVKRSKIVRVRALDRNGEALKFKTEGLTARIIQHELDHLNGTLFIDRARKIFQVKTATKLKHDSLFERRLFIMKKPTAVFVGTGEFAVPLLPVTNVATEVRLVITQPAMPAGKNKQLMASPVAQEAKKLNLSLREPPKIIELKNELTKLNPNIIIVVDYGQIIPGEILSIPTKGTLNIHPSLLPKYRGPSPIQAAILGGDNETGVTVMLLDEKMDHGPILSQSKFLLNQNEIAPDLKNKLAALGARMLASTLIGLMDGSLNSREQDHHQATYCELITKSDGEVTGKDTAVEAYRKFRAYQPWPGIWTMIKIHKKSKRVKLIDVQPYSHTADEVASGLLFRKDKKLALSLSDGSLAVRKLQVEGAKIMNAESFYRGYADSVQNV